jgi:hypothetical protein
MIAQLSFANAQQAYISSVGLDHYIIVRDLSLTGPTSQYYSIYLGNATTRALGRVDNLYQAINLCQADVSSLLT